jgi:hypothetical protein
VQLINRDARPIFSAHVGGVSGIQADDKRESGDCVLRGRFRSNVSLLDFSENSSQFTHVEESFTNNKFPNGQVDT